MYDAHVRALTRIWYWCSSSLSSSFRASVAPRSFPIWTNWIPSWRCGTPFRSRRRAASTMVSAGSSAFRFGGSTLAVTEQGEMLGRRTCSTVGDDDDVDRLVGDSLVLDKRDVLVQDLLQLRTSRSLACPMDVTTYVRSAVFGLCTYRSGRSSGTRGGQSRGPAVQRNM